MHLKRKYVMLALPTALTVGATNMGLITTSAWGWFASIMVTFVELGMSLFKKKARRRVAWKKVNRSLNASIAY